MKKYFILKEVVLYSTAVAVAILASTTIHEFLHFVAARVVGIPATFLNMTAVGVPVSEVHRYPASHLLFMNALAPLFSMLVLGILGFFYIIHRNPPKNLFWYVVTWLVLLNLPYLGLQLLLAATRVQFNGTGNDFAAVAGYFEIPAEVRAVLSIFGYFIFLCLLCPLKKVLDPPTTQDLIGLPVIRSKTKSALGISFLFVGLVCPVPHSLTGFEGVNPT